MLYGAYSGTGCAPILEHVNHLIGKLKSAQFIPGDERTANASGQEPATIEVPPKRLNPRTIPLFRIGTAPKPRECCLADSSSPRGKGVSNVNCR